MKRKKLGVNIDHVATLREARKTLYPDPVSAAVLVELAGADGITIHLREDRRHIQNRDLYLLRNTVTTRLNLEMALNDEILEEALKVHPDEVCIVPENRQEITTEGGLNVIESMEKLERYIPKLKATGIMVSLFVDPDKQQIEAAANSGADAIEIHTGSYAGVTNPMEITEHLKIIRDAVGYASALGLRVNAGHGLNYVNTYPIAIVPEIDTLNIGHAIICRAVMVGLERAVKDMLDILDRASRNQ